MTRRKAEPEPAVRSKGDDGYAAHAALPDRLQVAGMLGLAVAWG